ncbi:hypothetical protein D3C73_1488780 [compost metagenome]
MQREGKYVLLANDCGYAAKSWEEMILQGVLVNKKQAVESLQWVKKMSEQSGCIEVLANHDQNVKPHVIVV